MVARAGRAVLLLTVLLLAGCAGTSDEKTTGDDAVVLPPPDPLVAGPHTWTRLEYDFGQFVVDDPQTPVLHYPVPLHGSLHLPDADAGGAPLVLLLHGRHSTCDYAGQLEFLSLACADAPPVIEPVDSYTGYDGLAANLATWGYAVVSIDANTINDRDLLGDAGANARGALVLRTLDELAAVNATGAGTGELAVAGLPVTLPANAPGMGDDLAAARGRLDLSRVGLMGHSRGGEGVARAVSLDQERFAGAHGIDAVFALAPTDFARWPVAGVAFATLLPYCDGDVSNLQGAWMYDDARWLEPIAPRHQVLAMGANHNFYNTVWTGDDWGTTGAWCGSEDNGSGRDTPEQQRAHGYALMASFFRLYVGGESAFAPMWDGADSVFPASMCPGRASCDGRLYASTVATSRLDLAPDGMPTDSVRLDLRSCGDGECTQPYYGTAQRTWWDCHGAGFATFSFPDGLAPWKAVSMRINNGGPTGNTLLIVDGPWPSSAMPPMVHLPEGDEQGFPPRPGATDVEPGAKTVLTEVRFHFPTNIDLSSVTSFAVRCSGDGRIEVADLMLV